MISCTFPCESFIFFIFVESSVNTYACHVEFQVFVVFLEISRGVTQTFEFFDDFVIFVCDARLSRGLLSIVFAVIM
ncbi:hypothetical protein AR158_c805R [Paramecium bursaria Chlorella virus AR158]|uniref:hypothetical protein n=1 Tax=Paramecium bursaria Chlorella virus AR158 TaxID=380598 RepID=UPI00015AA90F|nr:hypothetical protein AR158_c805R [Paramecium bursaria Chlorella virus AR158]ABU44350.1 hypothetical protein AR158_c805R [Paramecium bursaria Chlorella virus AR158]